jgi:succinate dehydrogenase / fumarate reductase membrane anchor subunit
MNKNGFYGWIFQRFSTILITLYTITYVSLVLSLQTYDYITWTSMHDATWFKVYSTITLVIVMVNSLLAGWQIGTDYTQKVPLAGFGIMFHSFYTVVTLGLLVLGLYILWLL